MGGGYLIIKCVGQVEPLRLIPTERADRQAWLDADKAVEHAANGNAQAQAEIGTTGLGKLRDPLA